MFLFFRVKTQLQYTEDSEPVIYWWCAVQWANRNKLKVQTSKTGKQRKELKLKSGSLWQGGGDSLHWLSVKYPDTDGGYPWIIPLNTSGEEALTTAPGSMFQSRIVREKKNKSDKSGEHPIRLCVAMHLIILCDYFCFVTLFILTFLLLTARNQHVITFVSRMWFTLTWDTLSLTSPVTTKNNHNLLNVIR